MIDKTRKATMAKFSGYGLQNYLYGCLKGMIEFSPDFDPAEPAFGPEEWAEWEAEWDEFFAEFEKRTTMNDKPGAARK